MRRGHQPIDTGSRPATPPRAPIDRRGKTTKEKIMSDDIDYKKLADAVGVGISRGIRMAAYQGLYIGGEPVELKEQYEKRIKEESAEFKALWDKP